MKRKIRIGIILAENKLPLWISRVIAQIRKSDMMKIELLLFTTSEVHHANSGAVPFVFNLHRRLDRFMTRNRADYSKSIDASGILKGIPGIKLETDLQLENRINQQTSKEISRYELDIILNFSTLILHEPGTELARFGVWQYRVEPENTGGDEIICYWNTVNKEPVIETLLECSISTSKDLIPLHRSWIPTNFNSIHLNLDHAYGICSVIIPRLIKGFYQYGYDYFSCLNSKYSQSEHHSAAKTFPPPSNLQAIKNMFRIIFRYLYLRLGYSGKLKWFLLFSQDRNTFPDPNSTFQRLVPPSDRFWADPFVICQNGKRYIFLEEVIYSTNKGHIALMELNKDGSVQQIQKILEKPYHLSYPFVFHHDDHYYMIPESAGNKSIELYICRDFPTKWTHVMNLASGINAKDTTVVYHRNKWWMFTAINDFNNYEEYVELHLFYADDLFTTEWKAHPCNPVVTDIRNARPGGRIFKQGNHLYRPSQDCSERYGLALNLNQIVELNEKHYKEVRVSRTEATWFPRLKGTHTFNFDMDFSIIDVYKF
jgi:hypothetical protein